MKRRSFLKGAAVSGVAGATAVASNFPTPALSQGRMEWRLVTTWPANFPGLGTGANLLSDFITRGSDGRLTVKVFGAGEIVPAFSAEFCARLVVIPAARTTQKKRNSTFFAELVVGWILVPAFRAVHGFPPERQVKEKRD